LSQRPQKYGGSPATVAEEIRIADQATASAVARAVGIPGEHKSLMVLLAEISALDAEVHRALISYLGSHHIWVRRLWDREHSDRADGDAEAKLRIAAQTRDEQMVLLRSAIAMFRMAQASPAEATPCRAAQASSSVPRPTDPELSPPTLTTADVVTGNAHDEPVAPIATMSSEDFSSDD
jgi:hypothetical protein